LHNSGNKRGEETMTRVIYRIVVEDITDEDGIRIKKALEKILEGLPKVDLDVSFTKVPERPG